MKRIINRISPIILSCLAVVLFINSNSASCYLLNEPKQPESADKFKLF